MCVNIYLKKVRLIGLYFDKQRYTEALSLGNHNQRQACFLTNLWCLIYCQGTTLLKELKKLDDKQLLVEVQLLESKTYHAISNLSKARYLFSTKNYQHNKIKNKIY